jgi:hypothetical protein
MDQQPKSELKSTRVSIKTIPSVPMRTAPRVKSDIAGVRKVNADRKIACTLKDGRAGRKDLPLLFSTAPEEDSEEWKKIDESVRRILAMIGACSDCGGVRTNPAWTAEKRTAFRDAVRALPFRLEFCMDALRDGFYAYRGEELCTLAQYAVNFQDAVALQILLEEGANDHDYSPWAEARKEDVEIWRLWKLFDSSHFYCDGSTPESRLVKLLRRDDSRNALESLEDALAITKSLAA